MPEFARRGFVDGMDEGYDIPYYEASYNSVAPHAGHFSHPPVRYEPEEHVFDGVDVDDGGYYTDELLNSSPCPPERFRGRPIPSSSYHHPQIYRYENSEEAQGYYDQESGLEQLDSLYSKDYSQNYRPQLSQARQPPISPAIFPYSYSHNLETQNRASTSTKDYFGGGNTQPTRSSSIFQSQTRAPPDFRYSGSGTHSESVGSQPSQRISLKPISVLPDMYRTIFKFGVFNAVQSSCFDGVFHSNSNLVISAPTGSGKTVLFELAIIRMLSEAKATGQSLKCVYMAPTKALCSERYRDWANKFDPLGIKCCELTGDTIHFGKDAWGDARNSSIIITTGEKWDSLTRNWDGHQHLLSQVKLFLVDEVHILNEPRGSTLEVVVSRMKLRGSEVRFLLVSATVPNIRDLAAWIGTSNGYEESAQVYEFGEEFRPCKLTRHVVGVPRPKGQNDFVFSKNLDYKLFSALRTYSTGKPILVFVSTRKGVFSTAEHLLKDYEEAEKKKQSLPWRRPAKIDRSFHDKRLADLASSGIGVHHAGLTTDDRRTVEDLYLKQILRIVIATSTLAVGVNLPAHTVVLKGVHTFQNNASVEYSDLDVMQMMGRAGRPQFDKDGVAIIMCESELEHKYRDLVQGKTIVESSLHTNLSEHLNSEIGLGTIKDVKSAKEWLKSSFLFQRIQRNPQHYSLGKGVDETWGDRMNSIVMQSVDDLRNSQLIASADEGNVEALSSTEYGDIMSKFYIRQRTMSSILSLPERPTMREVLDVVSAAGEFADLKLRTSEKSVYNKLRRHNDIRYEVKKVEKTSDKILLIIQAILGGISLSSPEYKNNDSQPQLEAYSVFRHLPRIARAIVEVATVKRSGAQLKHGLELVRCFTAKAWEDRPVVLRQIDSVGEKSLKVLAEHGITSIANLRKQDSLRLETLLNRKPPFGLEMLAAVSEFPVYSLKVEQREVRSDRGRSSVEVDLNIECGLEEQPGPSRSKKHKNRFANMTAILTLTSDSDFVDFRRISTKALKNPKSFEVTVSLERPSQSILVYMASESFAGITVMKTFKPNVPSTEYPTRNTKPMSALEIDLEGLEDCPDLFEMDVDAHGEEIETSVKTEPTHFVDLTKTTSKATASVKNSASSSHDAHSAPKRLSNGNYECNHPCKDKQACRHLCCREGLKQPPKSKGVSITTKTTSHTSGRPSTPESSFKSIFKPKKSTMKPDQTLKDLEQLHKSTNVQDSLKLPQGHRLKLEASSDTTINKRKKPVPNFDISFSTIDDGGDKHTNAWPGEWIEEGDELPEAHEILATMSPTLKKRKYSSDDNYSNSELDALIRDLPAEDARGEKNRKNESSPSSNSQHKRSRYDKDTDSFKNTDKSFAIEEPPLLIDDSMDLGESEFPRLFDDQTPVEEDYDDFALDNHYYSTVPDIPDLTMSTNTSADDSVADSIAAVDSWSNFSTDAYIQPFEPYAIQSETPQTQDMPRIEEQQGLGDDEEEDDEFAALEAWLDKNTVA